MSAVRLFCGYIALVGPVVDTIAHNFLSTNEPAAASALHVTLFSKDELKGLTPRRDELDALLPSIDFNHVVPLGVGHHVAKGVRFVVIIWNAGQLVRKRFGLPAKQFHITLTKNDHHSIDKGFQSLSVPRPLDWAAFSLEELDQIAVYFGQDDPLNTSIASDVAVQMCLSHPTSEKGFLRLGDASFRLQLYKQAMLAYAKVLTFDDIPEKLQAYCVRMMYKCSNYTEWGCIFAMDEWDQIDRRIRDAIVISWRQYTIDAIASYDQPHVPKLCLESRERLYIPHGTPRSEPTTLPRFFRWIVPFQFAVMSTPRNAEDIDLLSSDFIGIRHVITLTEETPLPSEWFRRGKRPVTHTFMPIPNYQPPSVEQMDLILRQFEDSSKLPILIHCGGGKGRAGTVAACYIAAFGFGPVDFGRTELKMSAADAINSLRAIRPGSIETQQQEKFLHAWCSAVWKRRAILPALSVEPPPCDLEILGDPRLTSADLLVLVGLPGSGKSHFTRCLLARASHKAPWLHISQDNSGSRAFCETEIGRSGNTRATLDRCNTAADDRRYWLSLASTWSRSAVCVWFDYEKDLCISRAQNRTDHPTLPPGGRVRAAVASMQNSLVPPTLGEGFRSIAIVRSFAAAESLVQKLSPPLELFKFPRTSHIFDLGAATSDDLVHDLPLFSDVEVTETTVIITEKVDGANMGISLDAHHAFVVQNRSHYVSSNSHAQFSKLSSWLETPRVSQALHAILGADPYFPQRYTLFGEWMSATHSITYTMLPDLFIAFDLYDRSLNRWATRDVLERLVGARGIALVPIVERGTQSDVSLTRQSLMDMVQRPSHFSSGRVEGVYIKLERNGASFQRGKVVRGDFIAGNEHWTKGFIKWNTVETLRDSETY